MFWKFIVPVKHFKFVDLKGLPVLLIVNKNCELQKIYCGVSKIQLKKNQEKRQVTLNNAHSSKIEQIDKSGFSDFGRYLELKQEKAVKATIDSSLQELLLENAISLKVDLSSHDTPFMSMPSLGFSLAEFSLDVLEKPSKANNMTQLMLEFNEVTETKLKNFDKSKRDVEMKESHKFDPSFNFKDYFKF